MPISAQWTWLDSGRYRDSVRVHSKKHYNGGLFVLDADHVPTGCSSWPAFWFCGPNWPVGGEVSRNSRLSFAGLRFAQIDVMESVHLGDRNQMTLHTDHGEE